VVRDRTRLVDLLRRDPGGRPLREREAQGVGSREADRLGERWRGQEEEQEESPGGAGKAGSFLGGQPRGDVWGEILDLHAAAAPRSEEGERLASHRLDLAEIEDRLEAVLARRVDELLDLGAAFGAEPSDEGVADVGGVR